MARGLCSEGPEAGRITRTSAGLLKEPRARGFSLWPQCH